MRRCAAPVIVYYKSTRAQPARTLEARPYERPYWPAGIHVKDFNPVLPFMPFVCPRVSQSKTERAAYWPADFILALKQTYT
jgi:hypothetical protein